MNIRDIPVRVVGPGSQSAGSDGDAITYMDMPSDMSTFVAPVMPEPEDVLLMDGAREAMDWLRSALDNYEAGDEPVLADLSALDDESREVVNQILGEGEVSVAAVQRAVADSSRYDVYQLAGPGRRALAWALDLGIRLVVLVGFVFALTPFVALGLWWLISKTRLGVLVRAATQDREMVGALGVVPRLSFRWLDDVTVLEREAQVGGLAPWHRLRGAAGDVVQQVVHDL